MSSQRLRIQFETLFKHFNGIDVETQIEEITDILSCTRRNARMVLNKLEEQGWVEWKPSSGRGKSSQLVFRRSRGDVINDLAKRAIESGNLDAALALLEQDRDKLTHVINQWFGLHREQSLVVLRLPYYRSLPLLVQTHSSGRIEKYVIRKVYNGLVRVDDSNCLQPDLAHRWQQISPTHWRFYLRSGVRFHDGSLLFPSDVVDALYALKRKTLLFSHIDTVSCQSDQSDQSIDITLTEPDAHFDRCLADVSAVIRRHHPTLDDASSSSDIGTGPYKRIENSANKLVLQAFDDYFGYRPWVDCIEIHVIPQMDQFIDFAALDRPFILDNDSTNSTTVLEPGCQLLVLNRKAGVAKDEQWVGYLSAKLNSLSLFKRFSDSSIRAFGILPAYGLLPGPVHQKISATDIARPRLNRTLSLVYDSENPLFKETAEAIQQALAEDDIMLDVADDNGLLTANCTVDMWLQDMVIEHDKPDAFARWLMCHSYMEGFATSLQIEQCCVWVEQWRHDPHAQFNVYDLNRTLLDQGLIIPLFHRWLREKPFTFSLK